VAWSLAGRTDVTDAQWTVALQGLQAFRAAGHGAEAERLGWPQDELYRVRPLWSRIDLIGAALLVGDGEVVEVSAEAIRVKATSGSVLSIYRKPQPDYRLAYETRRKELARWGADEAHFRAFDHAVGLCRAQTGVDLEEAKRRVRAAIAKETQNGSHGRAACVRLLPTRNVVDATGGGLGQGIHRTAALRRASRSRPIRSSIAGEPRRSVGRVERAQR
jgi:hypothetical protein